MPKIFRPFLFLFWAACLFSQASPRAANAAFDIVPQLGHTDRVTAAAISDDNAIILTGSWDGEAKLWDRATGRLIRSLRLSAQFRPNSTSPRVECVALSADRKTALIVADNVAGIWNLHGQLVKAIKIATQTKWDRRCLLSPDGRLAFWSYKHSERPEDNTTMAWDIAAAKVLHRWEGRPFDLSRDGNRLLLVQDDNSVAVVDPTVDGRVLQRLRGGPDGVSSAVLSADGRTVATGAQDGVVRIWRGASDLARTISIRPEAISNIRFSSDNQTLLVGGARSISAWSVADGRMLRRMEIRPKDAADEEVVGFSPDGRFAAGLGASAKRKSTAMGNVSANAAKELAREADPDGPGAILWDLTTWRKTQAFIGNVGKLSDVSVSKTGLILAAGGDYRSAQLWELRTGRFLSNLKSTSNILAVALSPNGQLGLTGGSDGVVLLWDVSTRKILRSLSGGQALVDVFSVALSDDGRTAFAGFNNAVASTNPMKSWNTASGKVQREIASHLGGVSIVARTPNDKFLITSGESFFDTAIKLWDGQSGKLARTIEFPKEPKEVTVSAIAVSSDSRTLAAALSDSTIQLRDISTGRLLRKVEERATSVAISPDRSKLVAGTRTALVFFSFEAGQRLQTVDVDSTTQSVIYADDGRQLVSAHADGTIRSWSAQTNELLATRVAYTSGDWVTITPEGFFDASENGARLLSIVAGLDVYSIDQFKRWLYRPDLVREKLAGDPNGLVKAAAAKLDLNRAVASGRAPRITVTAGATSTPERAITLDASVADDGGGIGQIEWRINGAVLGLTRPATTDRVQTLRKSLALAPGVNRIEVVAFNAQGYVASAPAQVTVTSTRPAPTKPPRLFVLAAGIDEYRAKSFTRLNFAKADAAAIGAALKGAGGRLYESVDVTTLFDHDVTAAKLDEAFDRLAQKVTPDDVFVLFLAGHGTTTDGRFYYLPHDYTYGPAEVAAKAISQDRLQEWLVRIPAQRAVLVVDACQSGSLAEDRLARSGVEQATSVQRLNEAIGRAVLSATTDDAPAAEGMGDHGVFTYALLAGLSDGDANRDGVVDVAELGNFVKAKVPELTWRWWNILQAPQVKLAGARFPLTSRSSEPLVAALPDNKPNVLASATHTSIGATAVRQVGNGTAMDIAELEPGARVRIVQTRGDWMLVARDGKVIGYVEAAKLRAIADANR